MSIVPASSCAAVQKLEAQWDRGRYLCVGLDPDRKLTPPPALQNESTTLRDRADAYVEFCRRIVLATKGYAAAFKPNAAFFERLGHEGVLALERVCAFVHEHAPDAVLIYDAKRGDIGNTNEGYAEFAFDILKADAVTLHPYMGRESLKPFLSRKHVLNLILCRTSNPGAGEFQDYLLGQAASDRQHFYELVARHVSQEWNEFGNCGLVTGATYPQDIADIRDIAPDLPLLLPGIGAQGGDLDAAVAAGLDARLRGVLVNSSRGVIYDDHPGDAAKGLHQDILRAIAKARRSMP